MVSQSDASSRSLINLTKSFRHPIGEIARPFAAVHQGCPRARSALHTCRPSVQDESIQSSPAHPSGQLPSQHGRWKAFPPDWSHSRWLAWVNCSGVDDGPLQSPKWSSVHFGGVSAFWLIYGFPICSLLNVTSLSPRVEGAVERYLPLSYVPWICYYYPSRAR